VHTVLRSKNGKEALIGTDLPFTIIGERINPTGRKALAAALLAGNYDQVKAEALAQVANGATVLDVNAGLGVANAHDLEPEVMAAVIEAVQSVVDVPLSIDSSVVGALRSGILAAGGKVLVNSVTGENERMETVFPLVAEYHCAVVAISNDETGISMDPKVRFEVAKRIIARAETYGIPREDVLVDPLVMPAGAVHGSGASVLSLIRWINEDLGCNTVCGASNISFGLPDREGVNANFLAMVIAGGMSSAITNPLIKEMRKSILCADMLMGHDPDCMRWLRFCRESARAAAAASGEAAPAEASARRARRERPSDV
jgi:5-methyltetrahydrofolate--homocysteine methyltransferase